MRKLFVIAIVFIVSVVPVFAEGQIGISLTPEWFWTTSYEGEKYTESVGTTKFMLTVDGANYFGENGGFGIEYGLGMFFPVNSWQGNVTVSAEGASVGFVFRAGAGYRYAFSDLIGIAAGLGLNGTYQKDSVTYSGSIISVYVVRGKIPRFFRQFHFFRDRFFDIVHAGKKRFVRISRYDFHLRIESICSPKLVIPRQRRPQRFQQIIGIRGISPGNGKRDHT